MRPSHPSCSHPAARTAHHTRLVIPRPQHQAWHARQEGLQPPLRVLKTVDAALLLRPAGQAVRLQLQHRAQGWQRLLLHGGLGLLCLLAHLLAHLLCLAATPPAAGCTTAAPCRKLGIIAVDFRPQVDAVLCDAGAQQQAKLRGGVRHLLPRAQRLKPAGGGVGGV